jgi:hypothetical protein
LKNENIPTNGWSWLALIIGPFWYFTHGLVGKGAILLLISILSVGLAAPFVWIYCALRAKTDLHEKTLYNKSRISIEKI